MFLDEKRYIKETLEKYGPCHSAWYDHGYYKVKRADGRPLDLRGEDCEALGLDRCWTQVRESAPDNSWAILERTYPIGD